MQKTHLDVLNALLKESTVDLPQFRRTVSPAGSNLPWLKKVLRKNPEVSQELKDLINMDIGKLSKPVPEELKVA